MAMALVLPTELTEEAMNHPAFKKRLSLISNTLIALTLAVAPKAHASAFGAEPVKPIKFTATIGGDLKGVSTEISKEIGFPTGILYHQIDGKGRKITKETAWYRVNASLFPIAAFGPANILIALKGRVCNWQIDFVYKSNGREYMRERGTPIHECGGLFRAVRGEAKPKTLPKFGKACAELWVDGKFQAAQCHEIIRPRFFF